MTIPTLAMLGLNADGTQAPYADFSAYAAGNNSGGAHIYDPNTQTPNCAGTPTSPCSRAQFPLDRIPASRISAASLAYEKLADQTKLQNNLTYGTPIGLANWYSTGRIDYTQSTRNQISAIIAFGRQASTGPSSVSGLAPPFNTSQAYHPVTTVDVLKDTFTINSHLINQFAVGYGRYQSDSVTSNRTPAFSTTGNGFTSVTLLTTIRPPSFT